MHAGHKAASHFVYALSTAMRWYIFRLQAYSKGHLVIAAVSCLMVACRPYLCTGWDCYVVREPCFMCAMALTHSRIRRVMFCLLDPEHGVVASNSQMQALPSLNHHFQAFQMPLTQ